MVEMDKIQSPVVWSGTGAGG